MTTSAGTPTCTATGVQMSTASFVAPVVEESTKGFGLLILWVVSALWLKEVDGLEKYPRLYRVKNTQNPVISPKNCKHFDDIVYPPINKEP